MSVGPGLSDLEAVPGWTVLVLVSPLTQGEIDAATVLVVEPLEMRKQMTQSEVRQQSRMSWVDDLVLMLWSYVQKSQRQLWKCEVAVEWQ